MLPRMSVAWCVMVMLAVLHTVPPTEAFGLDFLDQLAELLFGDSSEETEMIINTKPNASITVVCTTGCDLNVMCVNCTNVSTAMVSPPANGNGGGNGTPANGNGNGGQTGTNGNGNGAPAGTNGNGDTTPMSTNGTGNGAAPPANGANGAAPPANGTNGAAPPANGANGAAPTNIRRGRTD